MTDLEDNFKKALDKLGFKYTQIEFSKELCETCNLPGVDFGIEKDGVMKYYHLECLPLENDDNAGQTQ